MPSLNKPVGRPPFIWTFAGENPIAADAIDRASTLAGAWLQEQNPRLLSMSTDLHFGNGLWCYVIAVAWVVSTERPATFKGDGGQLWQQVRP